jgi:hypothetical protein
MKLFARFLFCLSGAGLLWAMTTLGAACESDGVTPNCSPDGGDCVTPPGDAYPSGEAGTN